MLMKSSSGLYLMSQACARLHVLRNIYVYNKYICILIYIVYMINPYMSH